MRGRAQARGFAEMSTLGQMVLDAAARHSTVALQFQREGHAAFISYPELGAIASEIARGLISLGIQPGDRVAILGLTSADWTLADCGSLCAGAIVTPIYHTNSPEECEYVLAHSEAKLVFCENASQAAKIAHVRSRCPALEHVVVFDQSDPEAMTLDALRRTGMETPPELVSERIAAVDPDDIATLVYTSGTTGPPKACMLSHENLLYATRAYAQRLGFEQTHSLYQFLPLAHALARVAQMVVLSVGARIVYWTGDASKIVDELRQTAPTHFPAVPRIYEKVHGVAAGKAATGRPEQRLLFQWALSVGARARPALRDRRQPDLLTDLQYRLADRLVLSKVRQAFGPSLQMGLVGAAPVAKDLLTFFDACGVLVLEGYGLSETCAAATVNTLDAVCLGSVGRPLPGTEIVIAPDGEIMIRGPQVFKGYYKNPEATEQILAEDGWLRSGDLGAIDEDGFVSITGRKKEIIITSSGKNITPVNIESQLRDSRFVSEAVVYGDDRPYLVAMLTLDRDAAVRLAGRLGLADDPATIANDPRVHEEIQKEVDAVNAKFARIEQVKRFGILDHELTQAAGELTPTLKVKRSVVYKKYEGLIADLYASGGES
jgi:long-chain acyl-CoA synthetase